MPGISAKLMIGPWLASLVRPGRVVAADQTVILRESGTPKKRQHDRKMQILSVLDSGTNEFRPAVADDLCAATFVPVLETKIGR